MPRICALMRETAGEKAERVFVLSCCLTEVLRASALDPGARGEVVGAVGRQRGCSVSSGRSIGSVSMFTRNTSRRAQTSIDHSGIAVNPLERASPVPQAVPR